MLIQLSLPTRRTLLKFPLIHPFVEIIRVCVFKFVVGSTVRFPDKFAQPDTVMDPPLFVILPKRVRFPVIFTLPITVIEEFWRTIKSPIINELLNVSSSPARIVWLITWGTGTTKYVGVGEGEGVGEGVDEGVGVGEGVDVGVGVGTSTKKLLDDQL